MADLRALDPGHEFTAGGRPSAATLRAMLRRLQRREQGGAAGLSDSTAVAGRREFQVRDEFIAIVTDEGPAGEADYADARYWVERAYVQAGAATDAVDPAAETDPVLGVTVTATNLAEEVAGTHSLAVGRPVRVFKVEDRSSPPRTRYYFDAGGASGSGGGEWKTIETNNADGTYDMTDGTTLNVPEKNNNENVPVGSVVRVFNVGTVDQAFQYSDESMFLAKITDEPSPGNYSWEEVEESGGDGLNRSGTGDAEELNGRLGVPTDTLVWMRQKDHNTWQFDLNHGFYDGPNATDFTAATLNASDGDAADTDNWDVEDGAEAGLKITWVTRVRADTSNGGQLYVYTRTATFDSNGQLLTVSAESRDNVFNFNLC